jgi:hypothetical protein
VRENSNPVGSGLLFVQCSRDSRTKVLKPRSLLPNVYPFLMFNWFSCIGYLVHPSEKKALWAAIASIFQSVRGTQPPIEEGNRSVSPEKISEYGQPTLKKGIHSLHERAAKGLFRHDATSWMDLVPQLTSRI